MEAAQPGGSEGGSFERPGSLLPRGGFEDALPGEGDFGPRRGQDVGVLLPRTAEEDAEARVAADALDDRMHAGVLPPLSHEGL